MKAAACVVPRLRQKRFALKEQVEQTQRVVGFDLAQLTLNAGHPASGSQVDFEKLLGPRARALPVQPPHRAVGQHAPLNGFVRHRFGAAQIAQHLSRRRVRVERLGAVAAVERAQPALGFQNRQAVAIALVVFQWESRGLGDGVCKQQQVGHIFPTFAR